MESSFVGPGTQSFSHVASTFGLSSEATRLYSRLDSLPFGVKGSDPSWGLRMTSHVLRANAFLSVADAAAARERLLRFIEARSRPDSEIETDVREVMARLDDLFGDGSEVALTTIPLPSPGVS